MSEAELNRRASWEETQKQMGLRQAEVYYLISTSKGATASDIARWLHRQVYMVRPRITELFKAGKLVEKGSRWCNETGRSETIWALPEGQLELL